MLHIIDDEDKAFHPKRKRAKKVAQALHEYALIAITFIAIAH